MLDKDVRLWLCDKLTSWRETWNDSVNASEEEQEENNKAWNEISEMISKLKNKPTKITLEDTEYILFHLWQIYYDEDEED